MKNIKEETIEDSIFMKLLYITSLSGVRINGFMRSAIYASKNVGLDFLMACNSDMADKEGYTKDCIDYGIRMKHIGFHRNPLHIGNANAYKQLLNLMRIEKPDIIHCNTPIGGVLGRICAKKTGIKSVIYEAHGFHFWKGAPLINWIAYYPIEKILSKYTDTLITITKEDYQIAQNMNAHRIEYVHGVGINIDTFVRRDTEDRNTELRNVLGIPQKAIVLLSVGELNANKNHLVVLEALSRIQQKKIHYVICGDGKLKKYYEQYIKKHCIEDQVHLVGFQNDVYGYYRMADLFVFPSLREGIPGAIMEAIAVGIPTIASNIRGVKDIVQDERYRFDPKSVQEVINSIKWCIQNNHEDNIIKNINNIKNYTVGNVTKELSDIYKQFI